MTKRNLHIINPFRGIGLVVTSCLPLQLVIVVSSLGGLGRDLSDPCLGLDPCSLSQPWYYRKS